MRWRLALAVFAFSILASGCSTITHSSSSTTVPPSHNRAVAEACSYVQSWAKDPMTFELFSALAASAGSANNSNLHDEGKSLTAAIPTRSAEIIGNVLDKMVSTCIKLGLFKAPATDAEGTS